MAKAEKKQSACNDDRVTQLLKSIEMLSELIKVQTRKLKRLLANPDVLRTRGDRMRSQALENVLQSVEAMATAELAEENEVDAAPEQ